MRRAPPLACLLLALFLSPALATPADRGDAEDWEAWWDEPPPKPVNWGELKFLAQPPDRPVHHQHNHIILHPSSLRDGWVTVEQCHTHLDAVPRAEVLYHPERTRSVRILSEQHIQRAWVEGYSVQLIGVEEGARLCVEVITRTLEDLGGGSYRLVNGPFMRRFLDGYYPMRVTLDIDLPKTEPQAEAPAHLLEFAGITPPRQPGLEVRSDTGVLQVDIWFEGRLVTEILFQRTCAQGGC